MERKSGESAGCLEGRRGVEVKERQAGHGREVLARGLRVAERRREETRRLERHWICGGPAMAVVDWCCD